VVLVRDVFRLRFGKAREALALLQEASSPARGPGGEVGRVMTDLTGELHTVVLETEFEDLAALEAALARVSRDEAWRAWYGRFAPLVREGRREVFRVVETGPVRGL
jgi:hypothetical protein